MAIRKSGKTNTSELKYDVIEECGTISEKGDWSTKLRLISWNGGEAKYDIRAWKNDETGETCRKGITLTGEELESLGDIISKLRADEV